MSGSPTKTAAALAAVVHLGIGLLVLAGTVITHLFVSKEVLGGLVVAPVVGILHVGLAGVLVRGSQGSSKEATAVLSMAGLATRLAAAALWMGVGPLEPRQGVAMIEVGFAAVMAAGAVATRLATDHE